MTRTLHYAAGGGLGHLTRTLALLRAAPPAGVRETRILASSHLAPLARPLAPCPLDTIPTERFQTPHAYHRWLEEYLARHAIERIVLDTFPWGITGEWGQVAPRLPRLLVARRLNWHAYLERVGQPRVPFPQAALLIEPQPSEYAERLANEADCTVLEAPILLMPPLPHPLLAIPTSNWLVIHSGPPEEQRQLLSWARARMAAAGYPDQPPDTLFPQQGCYPAEAVLDHYRHVVSAAGYNSAAQARLAPPERRHWLHPFPRRFDDQEQRLRALSPASANGAPAAALWLWQLGPA